MPERLLAKLTGDPARPPLSLKPVAILIAAAYIGLLALIAGTAALIVAQDHRNEIQHAETELTSVTRALEADLAQTFGHIETVLKVVAQKSENGQAPTPQTWLLRTPQIIDFSIIKGSTAGPDLAVGSPRRTDQTREWAIPFSVPIVAPDERVTGQVEAQIRAAYFHPLFHDVRLNPHDIISITDLRGMLLLRYPLSDPMIGRQYSNLAGSQAPRAHETRIVSPVPDSDGRPSITAIRQLTVYPLVVHVTRPLDAALAKHRTTTERAIWGTIVLAALLGVLAWLMFEEIRRRETARKVLHEVAETLERRVQQRTLELETSNKELLAFSYSVSHDLRAPLRAINGFSRALQEDYADKLDETGKDYLDRIVRASVRMAELIDALLKLAQVARQPLELAELDFSAMVEDLVEDLRRSHPDRTVHMRVQPGMRAHADEALLRNVLGNLLDNAWKFTRERETAEIEVGRGEADNQILFWVRDNGIGFDMTYAGQLFQPFQQLHTRQGYAGTGIGLASARRIIERHGGRMWVESAPGQGTSVLFTLPRTIAVIHPR